MIQPLVENAFKHVSTYKEPEKNRIEITLAYDQEDDFVISVSNTYDLNSNSSHLMNAHGLGIQNLRRRLELLYPEKHLLEVAKDNDVYKTVLKIRHDD
jgi:LytS/YehU family sensor histidine kinase